jgi:hypothetical protein
MNNAGNSLSELSALLDERLALVGTLATSLEASRMALIRNDAEAIARGAAHQAELCYQWSRLEGQLRSEAARRLAPPIPAPGANSSDAEHPSDGERSAQLEAEWQALCKRIRYLTRVHGSLLRHMQRSLGILKRVVESCAPTYTRGLVEPGVPLSAGE